MLYFVKKVSVYMLAINEVFGRAPPEGLLWRSQIVVSLFSTEK